MDPVEPRESLPSRADATIEQFAIARDVFDYRTMRLFFVGGLLLTILLVVLSATSDAGPNPILRFVLLVAVLLGWAYSCCDSVRAASVLHRSQRPLLVLTAALIAAAALDGGLHDSILESEEYVLLGLAAASADARRVLWVSVILSVGMIASLPLGYADRRLLTEPVLSDLVTQWGLTTVLLAFLHILRRMWESAVYRLRALAADARVAAPPPSPSETDTSASPAKSSRIAHLSPAERTVVSLLVRGLAPKEIAVRRGTALETVRNQIKSAKRKTKARTIPELVALFCEHYADTDNEEILAANQRSAID